MDFILTHRVDTRKHNRMKNGHFPMSTLSGAFSNVVI